MVDGAPRTLIIQSEKSHERYSRQKDYIFSYRLAEPISFTKQPYARLLSLSGAARPVLVFADFVQSQHLNGQLAPFLGTSSSGSISSWVPLVSHYVPSVGYLWLRRADLESVAPAKFTVVIELAVEPWIN